MGRVIDRFERVGLLPFMRPLVRRAGWPVLCPGAGLLPATRLLSAGSGSGSGSRANELAALLSQRLLPVGS